MKNRYWLTIIILATLFFAVYATFFYLFHDWLDAQFNATAPDLAELNKLGAVHPTNARQTFSVFGGIMGLGFLAFGLVNSFFFWGVIALFRQGKNIFARIIILLLVYGVLLGIGAEMVFLEEGIYELPRSIKFYMGYPLLVASAVTMVTIIIFAIGTILKHPLKGTK